ncbi:hypothetical protein DBT_0415 [Dissulfuribacter thermophilus]|uniref:Uncharacterized protein n=1 Tax=Dissulfuribacter thermophilus TaxID=1156395 RepID=A0A1B9F7U5_9BACT|nr:hypothetical protein DBT_0415 [Dissulfuribacter thermophilus]
MYLKFGKFLCVLTLILMASNALAEKCNPTYSPYGGYYEIC